MKLALVLVLLCASIMTARAETIVLTADRWFDTDTGEVSGPVRVVVSDGLIEAVNPASIPADAVLIELGDRTLLPGLIDMHTHLTGDYFSGNHWVTMPVYETAADWAVLGTKFANDTLQAGFTTVRDVGALPGFPDVALMKAAPFPARRCGRRAITSRSPVAIATSPASRPESWNSGPNRASPTASMK